jgi:hypothetical protein
MLAATSPQIHSGIQEERLSKPPASPGLQQHQATEGNFYHQRTTYGTIVHSAGSA